MPTWLPPKAHVALLLGSDAWLLNLAVFAATIGIGGAMLAGHRLVLLEVSVAPLDVTTPLCSCPLPLAPLMKRLS